MSMETRTVELTIDGRKIAAPEGKTIWEAAKDNGIAIPVLCHDYERGLKPVGVCRVCAVEIADAQGRKARSYGSSCTRLIEPGMQVVTHDERLDRSRRTLVELLLSEHPRPCSRHKEHGDCELEVMAENLGIVKPQFSPRTTNLRKDLSNPSIAIDHSACILCDRCVRACSDTKHNFVIGRMAKGSLASISFDNNKPMGDSSCVNCGECMISCPTGAITSMDFAGTRLPTGEPLTVEALQETPIFHGISSAFLERNLGSIVRHDFRKGDIICRQGESGSTAFYILQGTVDVFIETPMARVKTRRKTRWSKRMISVLHPDGPDAPPAEGGARRSIRIDAPVDLDYDNPIAQLGSNELFGEMSCMNFYPRSATVRAAEDCVVLEMLRNVLDILRKNKQFRASLESSYRDRAMNGHLRSVPVLAALTDEFLDYLRSRVELVRFEPGAVICKQGDAADAFYLVRIGHIKVSQNRPGGEMVLNYLARGQYFGEIGLLGGGVRTATCAALDHVEVVRIRKEDFEVMLERFPEVRHELQTVADERLTDNDRQLREMNSTPLNAFLNQGLMEAQSLLILDLDKCTRCDACVRACGDAHDGVTRLVRDGLRFEKYLVASSCRQCRDPLCMVGCPVGSIRRRGSVEIHIEDWCIGCGLCAQNCPYGNINMHPFETEEMDKETGQLHAVTREKATACDLCSDTGTPACVYACPHEAAMRVEPQKFFTGR